MIHHSGKVGKNGKTLTAQSSSTDVKSKAGKSLAKHKEKYIDLSSVYNLLLSGNSMLLYDRRLVECVIKSFTKGQ